jgi:hypothetical protein
MARKYEVKTCSPDCQPAGLMHKRNCEGEVQTVTAIDQRDVEPLVEAAHRVLDHRHDTAARGELVTALKAFEAEEDSGG